MFTDFTPQSPKDFVMIADTKGLITLRTLAFAAIDPALHALLAEHMEALENDRVLKYALR